MILSSSSSSSSSTASATCSLFWSPPVSLPPCRRRLLTVARSLPGPDGPWKLPSLDPVLVQEKLSSWLLKGRTILKEATKPLVNPARRHKPTLQRQLERIADKEELFIATELTIDRKTPNGYISVPAVLSIEQFARLNGLTGRKIKKIFNSLAPENVKNDARSLVEYCCFRFLSKDNSDIHPNLKDLAFQRLLFVTMLAWEQPYCEYGEEHLSVETSSLQRKLVGEEAFVRIASAVPGVADVSTAHHLFKSLSGPDRGISLSLWTMYIAELLKVHQGRKSHSRDTWSSEQVLCLGLNGKGPVLKWDNHVGLPGTLTLTDHALYFEGIGFKGRKRAVRIDLAVSGSRIVKAKVGPLGSKLFDSAVFVSSGHESEALVLEFVDFGGEMRRDAWHAFISEIICVHEFIREYGPADGDPTIHHVYGADRGKRRAIASAANSIARLQCLQSIKRLTEDPAKLVQFSYLRTAPYGDVVLQTLAVNFWGGPLVSELKRGEYPPAQLILSPNQISHSNNHVSDIDGSVYMRKWMRSSTWSSSSSVAFWKNLFPKKGLVLSKNFVVADLSLLERAASTCRERSRKVEKTRETIDAAMIKGIPSNIDLCKELLLPCIDLAKKLDRLRYWEEPQWTISFLFLTYIIIFGNLLPYLLPTTFLTMATVMLVLKALKKQGRLGRSFGQVTIRDQPPSNTIQKLIALKEATSLLESSLQNLNVSLLKLRTIVLCGQPEVTTEVALVLLAAAAIFYVVAFKYILAFVILDLFTRELEFRREMVRKLMSYLKERWDAVYAAPVIVLPYENDETKSLNAPNVTAEQINEMNWENFEETGSPSIS